MYFIPQISTSMSEVHAWSSMKQLWEYIEEEFDSDIANLNQVRNGDIIKLIKRGKLKPTAISKILIHSNKVTESYKNQITNQVQSINKKFKQLTDHLKDNRHAIHDFLNIAYGDSCQAAAAADVTPPENDATPPRVVSSAFTPSPTKRRLMSHPIACSSRLFSPPPATDEAPEIFLTSPPILSPPSLQALSLPSPAPSASSPLHIVARRTRADCAHCLSKDQRIKELVEQKHSLAQSKRYELQKERTLHRETKKRYGIKFVTQKLKRKDSKIDKLKSNVSAFKKDTKSLQKCNSKLNEKLQPANAAKSDNLGYVKKIEKLEHQVEMLQGEIAALRSKAKKEERDSQAAIDDLKLRLQEASNTCATFSAKKNKKQYSSQVRILVFEFLIANCPVEGIAHLIKRCAEVR